MKVNYNCAVDKSVLDRAIDYDTWLICGTKDEKKCDSFKKLMMNKIKTVDILRQGKSDDLINSHTPGICTSYSDGTSEIKMYGFKDASDIQKPFIIHEFIHECTHSFSNCVPHLYDKFNPREIAAKNGKIYSEFPMCGQLRYYNSKDANESYTFGIMFAETFTDMFTTMGLIAYEPYFDRKGVTVDSVLKNHVDTWKDEKTGYSIFTSLTRLMFAAFNNCPNINYQFLVDTGYGIVDAKCTTKSKNVLYVNDFFYGMMFNPMHIESKYDSLMGAGAYIDLCARMDRVFNKFNRIGTFTDDMIREIKYFMNILSDFCNKKCNLYRDCGAFSQDDVNKFISNYNCIWNTLQREYSAFFSQRDIDDITRRAFNSHGSRVDTIPTIPPLSYDGATSGNSRVLKI